MVTFIERQLGTVTATGSAQTQTFPLPREHLYNRLLLRSVMPTSTTSNYVASGEDLMVERIEIIANGQLVLKSFSWVDARVLNIYTNAIAEVDKTGVTAAKTAGFGSILIDFSLSRKDLTTLLPSFKFTSLDLKLTFAANATYGGDIAANPYVDIWSREYLYTKEFEGIDFAFNKETTISTSPSATGYATIDLPIGNVYRRILFVQNGGASAAYLNTTCTDIELVQDGVIYHKKTTFLLNQAKDKQEFHLETKVTGYTMLGFDADGEGSATVDSAPFASWKLRANVTSVAQTVTLRVIPQELIYPRK